MSDPRNISPIVSHVCRVVARIIQIFAVYVVFHGHYSPGGGFQGGALLAAAVIILRITQTPEAGHRELPPSWALPLGAIGAFMFLGVGVVDLIAGGHFLEYEYTPLPAADPARIHYWGILIVEVGIALAVMAILVAIFDALMGKTEDYRAVSEGAGSLSMAGPGETGPAPHSPPAKPEGTGPEKPHSDGPGVSNANEGQDAPDEIRSDHD